MPILRAMLLLLCCVALPAFAQNSDTIPLPPLAPMPGSPPADPASFANPSPVLDEPVALEPTDPAAPDQPTVIQPESRAAPPPPAANGPTAGQPTEQQELITRAEQVARSLLNDPDYRALNNLARRAKAVLIVPNMVRLGFFLGGRGGSGVVLARGADGSWSAPAFYTVGGLSYGIQFGGQASELILTIMSEKGLQAILERQVTLGADLGAAVADIGGGAQAATAIGLDADVYAFVRSEGLFVGVAIDGTVITPRDRWNAAYYGAGITPRQILIDRTTQSPDASGLQDALP